MLHLERFVGSPAFCILMALLPTLTYVAVVTWYCEKLGDARAALALCLLDFFVALFFYTRSLHFHAEFTRFLAYRCLAQALVAAFVGGTVIFKLPGQQWNTWRYLAAVMVITLLVMLIHDVGFVMLYKKGMPASRFMQRTI